MENKESKIRKRMITLDDYGKLYHNPYIKFEAMVTTEETDFGDVNLLIIRAEDSKYWDEPYPERFEFKFNCDWIKDEGQQDWLAKVIASNMAELINQTRKSQLHFISSKVESLLDLLDIRVNGRH